MYRRQYLLLFLWCWRNNRLGLCSSLLWWAKFRLKWIILQAVMSSLCSRSFSSQYVAVTSLWMIQRIQKLWAANWLGQECDVNHHEDYIVPWWLYAASIPVILLCSHGVVMLLTSARAQQFHLLQWPWQCACIHLHDQQCLQCAFQLVGAANIIDLATVKPAHNWRLRTLTSGHTFRHFLFITSKCWISCACVKYIQGVKSRSSWAQLSKFWIPASMVAYGIDNTGSRRTRKAISNTWCCEEILYSFRC